MTKSQRKALTEVLAVLAHNETMWMQPDPTSSAPQLASYRQIAESVDELRLMLGARAFAEPDPYQ